MMNEIDNKLRVYNTLSGTKEVFEPIDPPEVRMYVCGITAYDYCHLGHARCYVAFDAVYRYLQYKGFRVTYIQNITDVDDKLIKKARQIGGGGDIKEEIAAISTKFSEAFFDDMEQLNVLPADEYPTATGNITAMEKIVSSLLESGHAYEIDGDVYFEVASFPDYGRLSGRNPDEMKSGARVEVDSRKKSPLDFALWKKSRPGEPAWESPWGPGRPGWHIECSAMSMRYLGPTFDIHGGGRDLIFPHHENEKAQSEAASGRPFARYWIHNGFVTINQEKMSKSLGNVFNLRDIFKEYRPMVIRFFLLSQHYRSPVDYSSQGLEEARRALFRLDNCYGITRDMFGDLSDTEPEPEALSEFEAAMDDDFNTASALAVVYRIVEEFYKKYRSPEKAEALKPKLAAFLKICEVLGIKLVNPIHTDSMKSAPPIELSDYPNIADTIISEDNLTEGTIAALLLCRQYARKEKDWDRADRIRDFLKENGVTVMDRPGRPSAAVYYEEELKNQN